MVGRQQLIRRQVSEHWLLASCSDPFALAVVDGLGRFSEHGPHYSRRTRGSATFTGIGQELVLLSTDYAAVWSVVRQKTPSKRGSGATRGRTGISDDAPRFVWRNNVFRNLGKTRSSDLIREATDATLTEWLRLYRCAPAERLRTEIDVAKVRSTNPGFCYLCAGWERGPLKRGKRILFAPCVALEIAPQAAPPVPR